VYQAGNKEKKILNLCPVIFGVMLFGWFISIYFSLWFMSFLFTSTFSGTQVECKNRASIYSEMG